MLGIAERQSHLSLMGVNQWYARRPLQGALASPEYVLVNDEAMPTAGVQVVSEVVGSESAALATDSSPVEVQSALSLLKQKGKGASDAVSSAGGASEQLADLQAKPSAAEVLEDKEVLAGLPQLSVALGAFTLSLYRTEQGLVISESASGASHPAEMSLLKNIMMACTALDGREACAYQSAFSWPVFKSLNLQSKQESELPALLHDWYVSQSAADVSFVMYFGSAFSGMAELFRHVSANIGGECGFYAFSHSLSDLLRIPPRKAVVWKEIQQNSLLAL